jgi:phage terminase large subunit-like protein
MRPIKQGVDNKIDGAVAVIMAIGQAMLGTQEPDLSDFFKKAVIG